MREELPCIAADCPQFVCRVCRTKVGWPHQRWCEIRNITKTLCSDCQYRGRNGGECIHPLRRREVKNAK